MSVNIRGRELYSREEVETMLPSGSMDSLWETHTLSTSNGYTINPTWKLNRFNVNKHTGLVTGEVGLHNMSTATSTVYGTNANLGIHTGMRLTYPGQWVYGTASASASAIQMGSLQMLNTIINSAGRFAIQGYNGSPQAGLNSLLETFAYIGSKYGKITTTDVSSPVYLPQGEFYDANTVDLITGKAWLRYDINGPSGYTAASFITFYKNLWSGEVIMQYSLYPTTAGTTPAIKIPERYLLIKKSDGTYSHSFFNARFVEGLTTNTNTTTRHHSYLKLDNSGYLRLIVGAGTWITGSQYYQGNPEVRPHNVKDNEQALWTAQADVDIPSVCYMFWPSNPNPAPSLVDVSTAWKTGYTNRAAYPSWVTMNRRTGMVYFYLDVSLTGTTTPDPLMSAWNANYSPSYRYNTVSGTSQPLYCSGANYISVLSSTDPSQVSYTANLHQYTGKSLGVATDVAGGQVWHYGTTGVFKPVANNFACFTGFYLGNSNGSILQ